MSFNRKADDGSFKLFENPPQGVGTFMCTSANALPQVNPHILKLELSDSKGRVVKVSYDQDKKDGKGRYAQRYFMNKMIDALLGDVQDFAPTDLLGKFADLDIVHNVVDRIDSEGEPVFEDDGITPAKIVFANVKTIIGPGTKPFALPIAGEKDDLSEDAGDDPLASMAD